MCGRASSRSVPTTRKWRTKVMTTETFEQHLVSGDWLQARLADPTVRIVDTRKCEGYAEAHIPGAVKLAARPFLRDSGDLLSPEAFSGVMAALGLSADDTVVAYDDGNNLFAARLWWAANRYGWHRIAVLDGGWDLWRAEGRPVEALAHAPAPRPFKAVAEPGWLADRRDVLAATQRAGSVILDVRSEEEWRRSEPVSETPVGHIPGAVHLAWDQLIDPATKRIRPKAEIAERLHAFGVTPDKEVITYCHAGIRAAHTCFVLRTLGYDKAKNYEGSWLDWARSGEPIAAPTVAA